MSRLTPDIPIRLGVKRRLSRRNDANADRANEEFERQRLAVLKRDRWTCRGKGCGFASGQMPHAPAGGMEIHHLDDDHHNNDPANLVTLCPFCHMAFTMGRRGASFAGTLGLLPGISQGELNLIIHTVWGLKRAMEMDESGQEKRFIGANRGPGDAVVKSAINEAWGQLNQVIEDAQTRLVSEYEGFLPEISKPEVLSAVLSEIPEKEYRERDRILEHVRLFPKMDHFKDYLDLWAEHVWLRGYPPKRWQSIAGSALKRIQGERS